MHPFMKHIVQGDIEKVRKDIHLVNTVLPMGKYTKSTPLIAAIASEKTEMIDFILECPNLQVSTIITTPIPLDRVRDGISPHGNVHHSA